MLNPLRPLLPPHAFLCWYHEIRCLRSLVAGLLLWGLGDDAVELDWGLPLVGDPEALDAKELAERINDEKSPAHVDDKGDNEVAAEVQKFNLSCKDGGAVSVSFGFLAD